MTAPASTSDGAIVPDGAVFPEAKIEDLAAIARFVLDACQRAGAGDEDTFAIRLAVEEAFTNVVRHGYRARPGPVRIGLRTDADRIVVTLVDEAPHFDPTDFPAPDLESSLEERQTGGLGWHLVCRMMDAVEHERRAGRGNVVTLLKRLT